MPLPTIEIVKLVAHDAYKQDPSLVNPLLEHMLNQPGTIAAWHGLEVQDAQHLFLVIAWETLEHHQAFRANSDAFKTMRELSARVATAPVSMHHARFAVPVDAALSAPVTELAVFTLKPDADRAECDRQGAALAKTISARLADVVVPGGWGPVVEDERKFQVCTGWQSLEGFLEVQKNQELLALIGQLREKVSDVDMKLVRFAKFTKS